MTQAHELTSPAVAGKSHAGRGASWLFSWPLLVGMAVYLFSISQGRKLLQDGDTLWHIAAGQWILQHGAIPTHDVYSHTMRGAAWTAHEWLAEIILAVAHQAGGWPLLVAITALAFAATIALLTRALLRWLEPIYVLLFVMLAVVMTVSHLLARPHVLAMPLMMVWTIELVHASEANRAPRLWLLPVMTLWANLHGGFTLGIALAFAFAFEALLAARREQRLAVSAKSWGIFLVLAVGSALLTPHGAQGLWFTWQTLFESSYALERIGEWRSPNFQKFQPLELWLLGGLALAMYQGLRLPPIRLALLLVLLHLALKHIRNVELVGLLAPLIVAVPLAAQWRQAQQAKQQLEGVDRFFRKLAQPAGDGAVFVSVLVLVAATLWLARIRPVEPPVMAAPVLAVQAVQKAGIKGPVLNSYGWGGYLIYVGIPPFIDGRADVYGDNFFKQYSEALELRSSDGLPNLLAKYKVAWTLLSPDSAGVAMLDHLPQWRRLYSDESAVVHVNMNPETAPQQPGAIK
ncbi:hypothetical protein [Caenimonas soli]|uniref:hypothetical protein n=1 Tax=Caenimonas soli TaxID=2735555 RepID=UPI0015551099|nr:hypothetical protein [Caenimonas soli]NPC55462.1 hypothetical protein [Caenimonas soli]